MALNWVNYLSMIVGVLNFTFAMIITFIVLRRDRQEKLNWLFASSFFFIAIAYLFLPSGAFTYSEGVTLPMVVLTKVYALFFFLGLELLMLSALAFNYGTRFVFQWFIIVPTVLAYIAIGLLLFLLNNTETGWYSIRANPAGGADTQTSLYFMFIFYPLIAAMGIVIFVYFIRAFRQTADPVIRKSLKYFIGGLAVSVSMIIPNILSNALADIWDNAQILNGVEFILVTFGVAIMLVGFLLKPTITSSKHEISYSIPVS